MDWDDWVVMVHETVMVLLVGLIRVMSRDKVSGIY